MKRYFWLFWVNQGGPFGHLMAPEQMGTNLNITQHLSSGITLLLQTSECADVSINIHDSLRMIENE